VQSFGGAFVDLLMNIPKMMVGRVVATAPERIMISISTVQKRKI
jgi:hypothetical protein